MHCEYGKQDPRTSELCPAQSVDGWIQAQPRRSDVLIEFKNGKATLISERGLYLMPATTYSPTHVWRGRPRPRKRLKSSQIPFREEPRRTCSAVTDTKPGSGYLWYGDGGRGRRPTFQPHVHQCTDQVLLSPEATSSAESGRSIIRHFLHWRAFDLARPGSRSGA